MSFSSVGTVPSSIPSPEGDTFAHRWRGVEREPKTPRKLILCFDGTGNAFTGTESDTNVVKLLRLLDRNDPNQFHYYQTGIGTYDVNQTSIHQYWYQQQWSKITQAVDQGFGTTFDSHVVAGYRFLMRYYEPGDKIYMFGFSRGAYTAKFLARMVYTVGLLCRGNEEMVPFAYRLYQRHLDGEFQKIEDEKAKKKKDLTPEQEAYHHRMADNAKTELKAFSETFCWKERSEFSTDKKANIKVFFLGLWDCVNSVAVMEGKLTRDVQVKGTAHYVRHAVAVDERRVKFKAALFQQDIDREIHTVDKEDIKEVWFPGNHGDIGGGWHPADDKLPYPKLGFWKSLANMNPFMKNKYEAERSHEECAAVDRQQCDWCDRAEQDEFGKKEHKKTVLTQCQLSDIPLSWMIKEMEHVNELHQESKVAWRKKKLRRFKHRVEFNRQSALEGSIHDPLRFGYGTAWMTVLFWNFLERFPLIQRWELNKEGAWEWTRLPLNMGNTRDIPRAAILHHSLVERLRTKRLDYNPPNNHRENGKPCLLDIKDVVRLESCGEHPANDVHDSDDVCMHDCTHRDHHTFMFKEHHDKLQGPHGHRIEG
ncbi:sporulation associated protein [Colletotrichum musicola]|uniref:Sporulation associated protein n=1 Tax=Colletotrichum musicola TaxID=2175873 RepID=A0A8H6NHM9_9PEZI|nr:sporulation associated protein [Colletotrichum musicola]